MDRSRWDLLPSAAEIVGEIFKMLALVALGVTLYVLYQFHQSDATVLSTRYTLLVAFGIILAGVTAACLLAFFGYVLQILVSIRDRMDDDAEHDEAYEDADDARVAA
jgi:protein-S-isoprenylcysteine O-methyltransferase Ste14